MQRHEPHVKMCMVVNYCKCGAEDSPYARNVSERDEGSVALHTANTLEIDTFAL